MKSLGMGLFILLVLVFVCVYKFIQPTNNQDPRTDALVSNPSRFHLYTRVTDVTWPQLKPYSRPGDLYWGHVDGIPANIRAFTFPDFTALRTRFTDAQSTSYAAINLDGEYRDYAKAHSEAKQIRTFIDGYNSKHRGEPGFRDIKFIAFYHLNIIDAYPDIVNFPDEIVVGKTNWTASNMLSEAKPYVSRIQAAGKRAIVLTSDKKALRGEREKVPNTNEEVLANFHATIDMPPSGLGLDTLSYYYDGENNGQLLFALQALRGR